MKISLLTIPISDKMVLFSYWIASTMGIIWLDYYKGSLLQRYQTPDLLEKAKLLDCAVFLENAGLEWPKCLQVTLILLGCIGIIAYTIKKLEGSRILFPCVGLIAITAVVPQFYNTEVRTTFLMTLTACLVAVFIFIRNYERVDDINPHSLTLMHRRYLEYLRSLIWIVAFILVGYFGWEITAFRDRFVCLVKLDMQEHLIAGLTQLGTTVGGGVGVVFYSITQKLNQVEKKL